MTDRLADRALLEDLARTCEDLERAQALPGLLYHSVEIYGLEMQGIFARRWLAMAREEDLAAPGSFVTQAIAGEQVLIVCDESKRLHAFFNVCRHRGARLVSEARGELRAAIICPYHAWSYGFDGELRRAPRMELPRDSSSLALRSMPLALHDGFVWVNLDLDAAAFDAGALPELNVQGLASLRRVARLEYELACNWKIVCENYSECYHCPGVHPQLSRLSDLSSGGFESGAAYNGGPMSLRAGVETLSMTGRSLWPRLSQGMHGCDVVRYYLVYPNLMLGVHPDYLLTHRVWPVSPALSRVDCEVFAAPEAIAAPGFDPADVVEFWDLTNRQDWSLCERVQQGTASRGYRPGPYHPSERCVHAFDRWYAEWLALAWAAREAK